MWKKLINNFLNAGLNSTRSAYDHSVMSIYNVITTLLLCFLHLIIINEIIRQNPKGVLIAIFFALIVFSLNVLNFKGRFQQSATIFCTVLPIGISLLALAYSGVLFLDFYYATFFLCALLFLRDLWFKFSYCLFYIGLYIVVRYCEAIYPPLLGHEFDIATNVVLGALYFIVFVAVSFLLAYKLKETDNAKDRLLHTLRRKGKTIEEANAELARLSALAAHDLKSPLRTISSYAGLVIKKNTDARLEPHLKIIEKSSKHMINLIDHTIQSSKLDEEIQELEEINMKEVVSEVKLHIGEALGPYTLVTEDLHRIYANRLSIFQTLQNVIENGVKYNESEQKKIIITQDCDGESHFIRIMDNGIGIDEAYQEKIFEMYERLHDDSKYEGTGIGLAICKKALNKLGGDITLISSLGSGSTFTLIIPQKHKIVKDNCEPAKSDTNFPGLNPHALGV